MNGHSLDHENRHEPSLEDSIASLLSTSDRNNGGVDETITTTTTTSYKRSAKLFINKKFYESFKIVEGLVDDSFALLNSEKIDESLFNNIWSLYFNLIDIFLNKSTTSLPKHDRDELTTQFQSDDLFQDFYKLDSLVHPKLIVLLVLIKLNNEATDLPKLRSQVDLYLVNISSEVNHTDQSDERYESFQELLEIYHVYLLPKLNEFEESEFLIKTNPLINQPDELLTKLKQTKIDMENKAKQQKELAKKRALEAQKRKEQQLREEEEIKRNKLVEKARAETIAANSAHHNSKITRNGGKDLSKDNGYSSILEILKQRIINYNKHLTNSSVIIMLLFSLLSLLFFTKTHKLLLNKKIRELLASFWNKVKFTFKMASQVTYM